MRSMRSSPIGGRAGGFKPLPPWGSAAESRCTARPREPVCPSSPRTCPGECANGAFQGARCGLPPWRGSVASCQKTVHGACHVDNLFSVALTFLLSNEGLRRQAALSHGSSLPRHELSGSWTFHSTTSFLLRRHSLRGETLSCHCVQTRSDRLLRCLGRCEDHLGFG